MDIEGFKHDSMLEVCNIDTYSREVMPNDTPTGLSSDMVPVEVRADGNCLPRSASLLTYGHENAHYEMRVRIIVELAQNL